MSIRHYRPPVTETLPPFIFWISRCIAPQFGLTVELWKAGHYLTVQFPMPAEHVEDLSDYIDEQMKELQPFSSSLAFGKVNWAYFVRNRNGKRALAHRKRTLRPINYLPFAPVVHESELTYIRPVMGSLVEGVWRGQQVDAFVAVSDVSCRLIEKHMEAHELMRGLDLTYEVLAHLVDSDGNITGILYEPAFGRPFQASDILALNDAMCRLYDRGLYWYLVADNVMMSLDNKIRFLNYGCVRKFRDAEERSRERLILQNTLHQIYLSYKGFYHWDSSHRYRHVGADVIDATPPLEFPIHIYPIMHCLTKVETTTLSDNPNTPLGTTRLRYRSRHNLGSLPLAATTRIDEVEESVEIADDEDKPLSRIPERRTRIRRHDPALPYDRSSRRSRKLLLAPE